jgi:hypothetical protein
MRGPTKTRRKFMHEPLQFVQIHIHRVSNNQSSCRLSEHSVLESVDSIQEEGHALHKISEHIEYDSNRAKYRSKQCHKKRCRNLMEILIGDHFIEKIRECGTGNKIQHGEQKDGSYLYGIEANHRTRHSLMGIDLKNGIDDGLTTAKPVDKFGKSTDAITNQIGTLG